MAMTRRERVYAAANRTEPDRVPISFAGTWESGITECSPDGKTCSRLYEYLGLKDTEPIQISDAFNIVANHDQRLIDRLHSDMIVVGANTPPARVEPDGTKTWEILCGMRIKRTGYYDDPFEWPMRYMTTEEDVDKYPWPDTNVDVMEGVIERAKYLHQETDYFVVGDSLSNVLPFSGYAFLFGIDRWLMDMKERPKFYHKVATKLMEVGLAISDQFLKGIGKYLDAAVIFDDLGTQQNLLMSLADYREFYKPYTVEIIRNIRKYIRPEAKILLHSCGSVYYAIDDLIEIGVDILHPVQPLAKNMEPWRIKKEFGDRIALMGGLDIQQFLPCATPEQIREGVKKLISEYAQGGGFIFAATHNIEPDTTPENIVAAYDAAVEFGKYPIPKPTGQSFIDFIKGLTPKD